MQNRACFIGRRPKLFCIVIFLGPPPPTRTILLEDKGFQIRENLAIALQQLQHHRDELVLWVDAICINQEGDKDEKGRQLQLMGTIFSGAAIVLAWLGAADAANDSDTVMKTLNRLGKACVYSMPRGSEFYDISRELIPTGMKSITFDHVEAMSRFFRREWWYRVWIFQEMELAKYAIMICGDFGMAHGILVNAYSAISRFALETKDGHPTTKTVA
jgi:hypothetical protein